MKNFTQLLTVLFLIAVSVLIYSNASGPGAGYANDPGQTNCTTCHSGTVNTGGGSLSDLKLTGDFDSKGYKDDTTYIVTLEFNQTGRTKYGFCATVLDSKNNPVGTLTTANSNTRKVSKIVNGKTRQYMNHSSSSNKKWTFKWKTPKKNVGIVKFYVSVLAANNNGMNSGDFTYVKTFDVIVEGIPVAKATANKINACLSDSIQFTGSATENPTKWTWNFGGGKTSNLQNPKFAYNGIGSKTVTLVASNAKGSSKPVSLTINVSSPSVRIYGNDTNYFCKGDSILLKSSFVKNATYLWSPFGEKSRNIWAKKPGNYQITVMDTLSNCTAKSNTVVVIENPSAKATLVADKMGIICSDQEITFTATPNNADSFYFYLNTNLVSAQATPIYKRKLNNTSKMWVDIKTANGCGKMSDTLRVKIAPKSNKPTPICGKTTPSKITVFWKKEKYATGYKIRKGTDAWISLGQNDSSYTFTSLDENTSYNFEVKTTSLSPCMDTEVGKVTCKTTMCNTSFTLTAPTEICPGDDARIELSNISATNYKIKINGTNAQLVNTYKPTTNTSYAISVSDLDNPKCLSDSTHTVKIKKVGTLNIIYSPKDSVCYGKQLLLSSKFPRTNYEVFKDGIKVGSTHPSKLIAVPVTGIGNHQIHVTAMENGCKVTSATKTITFLPQTLISFTKKRSHTKYTFTPDNTSLKSYTWYKDGKQFSTDKISVLDLSEDEKEVEIKLVVIDNNNCDFSSDEKFTTPKFSSLAINNPFKISVYPNPSSGIVNIDLSKAEKGVYNLKVFNINAKLILEKTISETESLNLNKAGVYFVELMNTKGEKSLMQVVVQ